MGSTALHNLCQSLSKTCGIFETGREDCESFRLSLDQLPPKGFAVLNVDLLNRLAEDFGKSIDFQVGPSSTRPLLKAGTVSDTAAKDIRDLKSGGVIREFRIEINKELLSTHLGFDDQNFRPVIYLFEEKLNKLLSRDLQTIDNRLFENYDEKVLVYAFDGSTCCTGPVLSITNPDHLEEVQSEIAKTGGRVGERIERYRAGVRENLNWTGFDLNCLTPLHLMMASSDGGETKSHEGIAANLQRHLFHLCILFTADRCELLNQHGSIRATFTAPSGRVDLRLQTKKNVNATDGELARLALWPYMGGGENRLTLLRNVVVRELDGESETENYWQFDKRVGEILSSASWHHRVFLNGQIDQHFEQVRNVTDYVATVTEDISKRVESLTSELTRNLLATLGVIILSALPVLFKQNTVPDRVIVYALRGCATYLLFVPCLYKMGSTLHSQLLLTSEVRNRKRRFGSRLGSQTIEDLMSPFESRKTQFYVWFGITVALYLITSIGVWITSPALPVILKG